MAWEENSRICLHMQLIAILSRIGVYNANLLQYSENSGEKVLNHFVFSYLFDNFGVNY